MSILTFLHNTFKAIFLWHSVRDDKLLSINIILEEIFILLVFIMKMFSISRRNNIFRLSCLLLMVFLLLIDIAITVFWYISQDSAVTGTLTSASFATCLDILIYLLYFRSKAASAKND